MATRASTRGIFALPLLLLLSASSTLATLSADQIVDGFGRIGEKVFECEKAINLVDFINIEQAEKGEGPLPPAIQALYEVVNITNQENAALQGAQLPDKDDQQKVTDAYNRLADQESRLMHEWGRGTVFKEQGIPAYQVVAPSVAKPLTQLLMAQDLQFQALYLNHLVDRVAVMRWRSRLYLKTIAAINAWTIEDSLPQV